MTLSVSTQVSPVGTKLVVQSDANATPDINATGAAGTIYMIDVDNTANAAASFLKIFDNGTVTVGTTAPGHIYRIPANQRRAMAIPEGLDFTVLSFAVTTTGGTSGNTDPSSAVIVRMVTS